jgi:hypothetical protein
MGRNLVIRCSDELYAAARSAATRKDVSLSDYVRHLIIRDVERARGSRRS